MTLWLRCVLGIVGMAMFPMLTVAQDCPYKTSPTCSLCLGLRYCSNRSTYYGGPYFDTLSLRWDTIDSVATCTPQSVCSPEVPACVNPPMPGENACTKQRAVITGSCRGVGYSVIHSSCCDLAT